MDRALCQQDRAVPAKFVAARFLVDWLSKAYYRPEAVISCHIQCVVALRRGNAELQHADNCTESLQFSLPDLVRQPSSGFWTHCLPCSSSWHSHVPVIASFASRRSIGTIRSDATESSHHQWRIVLAASPASSIQDM